MHTGARWHRSSVHPRVCGELDVRQGGQSKYVRFIPACAGNSTRAPTSAWRCAVHPRVCGELRHEALEAPHELGSSPRVRGTHAKKLAGKAMTSVHPRVCGELFTNGASTWPTSGSSPRVRGTPAVDRVGGLVVRFIPACAGNSAGAPSASAVGAWFIPACAGNSLRNLGSPLLAHGSSPRVRGTRRDGRHCGRRRRFIPACAGNSPLIAWPSVATFGSSPRVRGTRPRPCRQSDRRRFIPACAGNSRCPWKCMRRTAVHPRVCGELALYAIESAGRNGSSPRVRGTPVGKPAKADRHRFIPACAGNSSACSRSTLARPVHPRVCGELHGPGRSDNEAYRFIPACAGNSLGRSERPTGAPVHPRVCGELVALGRLPPSVFRFIPACAGNSSRVRRLPSTYTGSSPRVRGTPRPSAK